MARNPRRGGEGFTFHLADGSVEPSGGRKAFQCGSAARSRGPHQRNARPIAFRLAESACEGLAWRVSVRAAAPRVGAGSGGAARATLGLYTQLSVLSVLFLLTFLSKKERNTSPGTRRD